MSLSRRGHPIFPPHAARAARASRSCRIIVRWAVSFLMVLAGCAPPAQGRAAPAPLLYVTNSLDGTITRIDSTSGQALGPPIPAGVAPWQIVAGPRGTLLVHAATLPAGNQVRDAGLTFVALRARQWVTHPVSLEPGAFGALIAGDGGQVAAIVYRHGDPTAPETAPRCRLALLDLFTGAILRTLAVCSGRDSVVSLALAGSSPLTADAEFATSSIVAADAGRAVLAGTTVYLSIWRPPAAGEPCGASAGARIVAMQFAPDRAAGFAPVAGVPGPLLVASAPGGIGQRLYAAIAAPAAWLQPAEECEPLAYEERFESAARWELVGLNTATLEMESSASVAQPPRALAATSDGNHAYLLAGQRTITSINLASGKGDFQAALPDIGAGLAVAGERIYVPNPFASGVWALDRHNGRLIRTVTTGRHPLGITLAAAARD